MRMKNISFAVQSGDTGQTRNLVARALKENCPPADILKEGLVSCMVEIGKRYRRNEISGSEFIVAEQAMKTGLHILIPALENKNGRIFGTAVTGTLEGDLWQIKKNIIALMMRSLGLRVVDLGTSVSTLRFIDTAVEERAEIIVCSTALTIFLPRMKSLVKAAEQSGIRGKTKLLFSGGPVTECFCKTIGADMYAPDPVSAAETAAAYCRKVYQK